MTLDSPALYARACRVIPGGVNSPVRAFKAVAGEPLFIDRGEGPFIFDVEGRRYIDYVASWGPLILGHCPEIVEQAINSVAKKGTSFGAPTSLEVEFAELLTRSIPGLEMVRLVNSGTEATMSAIRLARGVTGRKHLIKFNGCYHGHGDSLLIASGSGVATFGIPGSPGVPEEVAALSHSVEFNDLRLLEDTVSAIGGRSVAAIILEPVPGNMGLILPEPGFLQGIRDLCNHYEIILIFDEVMSGFRVAFGGAGELFGVRADLFTFGKIIGGGLPLAAFGGKAELMKKLAPEGPIYQAGTLSGNPLAVAAGLAMVNYLRETDPYPTLLRNTGELVDGLKSAAAEYDVPLVVNQCGSMFGFFFTSSPVRNFEDAKRADLSLFNKFFHGMLSEGVYLAPSAFETGFVSMAHEKDLIVETVAAARRVIERFA